MNKNKKFKNHDEFMAMIEAKNQTDLHPKPFRTYQQLIGELSSKHLIIDDPSLAIKTLKSRSYYGIINAFKDELTYRSDGKEFFEEGIKFSDLIFFYNIDSQLKSLLLRYTLLFETKYSQIIGQLLGLKYGNDMYRLLNNTDNFGTNKNFIDKEVRYFNKKMFDSTSTKFIRDYPTKHYRNKHLGIIPPWILVQNLTLAEVNSLYDMLKITDKRYIVSSLLFSSFRKIDDNLLESFKFSIELIRNYRNKLAHNSRIIQSQIALTQDFNYSLLTLMWGENFISKEEFKNGIGNKDILSFIAFICSYIDLNDQNEFLLELTRLINRFEEDNLDATHKYEEMAGIPIDFLDRLQNIFLQFN